MAGTVTEWRAELPLGGDRLECTLRRSTRARRVRLTVDPRTATVVTIPARSARNRRDAERLATEFVREREAWLRRHLDRRTATLRELAARGPIGNGGVVVFRGEPHRIRVVVEPPARRTTVSREGADDGDELVVRLAARERRPLPVILEAFLRDRARLAIEREIDRHAGPLGVSHAGLTLRDPRTRWGSCSKARRLSFSWRLVLAPPEALETVVVHELAHLRVFGHGPSFWALVGSRLPAHREWRRWLRDHALELHNALEEPPVSTSTG